MYHHAAIRLGSIIKYYFSENYLRYVFHSLPFANRVPLEKCNLKPLAPIKTPVIFNMSFFSFLKTNKSDRVDILILYMDQFLAPC